MLMREAAPFGLLLVITKHFQKVCFHFLLYHVTYLLKTSMGVFSKVFTIKFKYKSADEMAA